jgi:Protein of unknown function (DUF1153)
VGVVTDTIPRRVRIVGPDGRHVTFGDLPPATTKRWVVRRKVEVVAAVSSGVLSIEEACKLYGLTAEEFLGWQHSIDRHGYDGLRATQVQKHRPNARRWHVRRRG